MRLAEVLAQMKLPARSDTIGETDRCCAAARCTRTAASCCIVPAANGNPRTGSPTASRSPPAAMCWRPWRAAKARENAFIALGYAGWEAGPAGAELKDNAWLTLPLNEALLFDLPYEDRWTAAWRLLGVDVSAVSSARRSCLSASRRPPARRPRLRFRPETHRHRQRRHADAHGRAAWHRRAMHPPGPDWTGHRSRNHGCWLPTCWWWAHRIMTTDLPDASPAWPTPSRASWPRATACRCERMDERYSSTEAGSLLREQRASGQRRRRCARATSTARRRRSFSQSWLGAQTLISNDS